MEHVYLVVLEYGEDDSYSSRVLGVGSTLDAAKMIASEHNTIGSLSFSQGGLGVYWCYGPYEIIKTQLDKLDG